MVNVYKVERKINTKGGFQCLYAPVTLIDSIYRKNHYFLKYKKFLGWNTRKFRFLKYQGSFCGFRFLKYKKSFLWENFFAPDPGSSISQDIRNFFVGGIFYSSTLGSKRSPGSFIIYYCFWLVNYVFNMY